MDTYEERGSVTEPKRSKKLEGNFGELEYINWKVFEGKIYCHVIEGKIYCHYSAVERMCQMLTYWIRSHSISLVELLWNGRAYGKL